MGLDPSDDAGTTCSWVLWRGKDWPWWQIKADVRCKLSTRRVLCWLLRTAPATVFSTRCNIYISHLCYDVSVRLFVCPSVTFVHCGHRVQWIPDIFACLHDRWMSLLLTNNASPKSKCQRGHLVACISLIFRRNVYSQDFYCGGGLKPPRCRDQEPKASRLRLRVEVP